MLDVIDSFINFDTSCAINSDLYVSDNGGLVSPIINIGDTLKIDNHGMISGAVNVCENCSLTIENSGVFNATFDLASGAEIVQLINSADDVTNLNFNTDYRVLIKDANGISLDSVINSNKNANSITVSDSVVQMNMPSSNNVKMIFNGTVGLRLDDVYDFLNGPLLSDVDAGAFIYVDTNVSNPIYTAVTYVHDNDLYVKLVRETDYSKFLDSDVGAYINSLRGTSGGDSFLYALDNAKSINQIYEIMADSVRISPINLMDSVRVLNAFELNDFDYNNGMRATYVGADNLYAYGVALNTNYDIKKFNLGMRVYFNSVSATDNYDDFNGLNFGASAYTKYTNQNIFVRGLVGANITQFDIDNLFDGTDTVDNPIGVSGYGVIDLGYDINFTAGGYVSPYVGLGTEYVSVLDKNESAVMGRVGLDMGYEFDVLGIGYKYGLRTNIDINQDVFVGAHAEFISVWDNIGGYADCGFINNENGRGYKIAAGIDFKF